jgi:selenide,water dikinase
VLVADANYHQSIDTILLGLTGQNGGHSPFVGNDTRDDAAVYDMGKWNGIISTTDFFLAHSRRPFTFGRIAATML